MNEVDYPLFNYEIKGYIISFISYESHNADKSWLGNAEK